MGYVDLGKSSLGRGISKIRGGSRAHWPCHLMLPTWLSLQQEERGQVADTSWPRAVRRPYICEFNMECLVLIPDLHIPGILIHPYLIRCFLPSPLPFARRKGDSQWKSDSNSREHAWLYKNSRLSLKTNHNSLPKPIHSWLLGILKMNYWHPTTSHKALDPSSASLSSVISCPFLSNCMPAQGLPSRGSNFPSSSLPQELCAARALSRKPSPSLPRAGSFLSLGQTFLLKQTVTSFSF